jgi:hypothetical protein
VAGMSAAQQGKFAGGIASDRGLFLAPHHPEDNYKAEEHDDYDALNNRTHCILSLVNCSRELYLKGKAVPRCAARRRRRHKEQ